MFLAIKIIDRKERNGGGEGGQGGGGGGGPCEGSLRVDSPRTPARPRQSSEKASPCRNRRDAKIIIYRSHLIAAHFVTGVKSGRFVEVGFSGR